MEGFRAALIATAGGLEGGAAITVRTYAEVLSMIEARKGLREKQITHWLCLSLKNILFKTQPTLALTQYMSGSPKFPLQVRNEFKNILLT